MRKFDIEHIRDTLPETAKKYFDDHKRRFESSLNWIDKEVNEKSHILEIGSPNMFTDMFKKFIKHEKYCNTHQDLRNRIEYPDSSFNIIIFMEVIEHIKDVEEIGGFNETFYGSGQRNAIKECYRMLKSDGVLFLTTPNLNSIRSLKQLLSFDHPFTYWPHVREMSVNDIKSYLIESGFIIETISSENSWYDITDSDKQLLTDLEKYGFSSKCRDDNLFVIARKV